MITTGTKIANDVQPGDVIVFGGSVRRVVANNGVLCGYVRLDTERLEAPRYSLGNFQWRSGSSVNIIVEDSAVA